MNNRMIIRIKHSLKTTATTTTTRTTATTTTTTTPLFMVVIKMLTLMLILRTTPIIRIQPNHHHHHPARRGVVEALMVRPIATTTTTRTRTRTDCCCWWSSASSSRRRTMTTTPTTTTTTRSSSSNCRMMMMIHGSSTAGSLPTTTSSAFTIIQRQHHHQRHQHQPAQQQSPVRRLFSQNSDDDAGGDADDNDDDDDDDDSSSSILLPPPLLLPAVFPNLRAQQVLHEQLTAIGVDAEGILKAAIRSMEEPTAGYSSQFGKPAIRTYRAFVFPKRKKKKQVVITSSTTTTTTTDISNDDADGDDLADADADIDDSNNDDDDVGLVVTTSILKGAAGRTARQVDFLIKRHQSHQTEWIRHHDVIRDRRQVFPLILILDNVRSAFNVGSLYRTADAAGCQAVYTCGITPHPDGSGGEKLAKSALGAERVLDTLHFDTTREAMEYLRRNEPDYFIVGMETTEQSVKYSDVSYMSHAKIALVLGNEVTGVDTQLLPEMDQIVELPTFGAKNSLNVAACAPVVLYEILRQWNV